MTNKKLKITNKEINNVGRQMRNVWDRIPTLLWELLTSVWVYISNFLMKTRAWLVLMLTQDIARSKVDRSVWERASLTYHQKHKNEINLFKLIIIKIKKKFNDPFTAQHCNKIYHFVSKGKEDDFISYSIEYQHDKAFINIRNRLLKYFKIVESGETNIQTELESERVFKVGSVEEFEKENTESN